VKVGERQICISVINISSHPSLEFSSSFSSRNLDFQKRSPNVSEVNAVRYSDTPLPNSPGRGLYSLSCLSLAALNLIFPSLNLLGEGKISSGEARALRRENPEKINIKNKRKSGFQNPEPITRPSPQRSISTLLYKSFLKQLERISIISESLHSVDKHSENFSSVSKNICYNYYGFSENRDETLLTSAIRISSGECSGGRIRNLHFPEKEVASPSPCGFEAFPKATIPSAALPQYSSMLYSWTAVRWRSSTAASRKRGRQLFPYRPILRSKKVIRELENC